MCSARARAHAAQQQSLFCNSKRCSATVRVARQQVLLHNSTCTSKSSQSHMSHKPLTHIGSKIRGKSNFNQFPPFYKSSSSRRTKSWQAKKEQKRFLQKQTPSNFFSRFNSIYVSSYLKKQKVKIITNCFFVILKILSMDLGTKFNSKCGLN